jgi:predicted short-subunit dehydrogenase-like oxidoreductase (DUF2520 family)
MSVTRLRVIGPGRAGTSLSLALRAAGWDVASPLGRGDDLSNAADDVDLLVIATPDAAIAEAASAVTPNPSCVVAHLAGSLGLDVLVPHERRAAIHPLVALPTPEIGAARLAGATYAVTGDALGAAVVTALGGTALDVADAERAAYHAAACIASNHLVALLGQVERVAALAGVPLSAYLPLVRATIDNVDELGPAAAITGPAARGDIETVARHLAALDPDDRASYALLAEQCRSLACAS